MKLNSDYVRKLHSQGFAIHWLHAKSKRPIEMKWSSGARKSLSELKAEYKKGMNVGVRLGKPSKIGDRFLAVIDCDVKSEDPRHIEELENKLSELFGVEVRTFPSVVSGRGNGSRHIYITTDSPVKPRRLSQSSEKVKLFMPSAVKASRYEKENLSEKELDDGFRLRAAWEISLMGDGQQVVLPPSIHPDSGKAYQWFTIRPSTEELLRATITLSPDKTDEVEREKLRNDWKPVDVDLIGSALPNRVVDQIISGEGVEDRSSALLGVCNSLVKHRFSDDEILTVLTDRGNALGEVAYEHAQTDSRARAANWVKRYTLDKSKREILAEEVFDDNVEVDDVPTLSSEAAELQARRLVPEKEWFEQIERGPDESGARPKNTLKNVILILQGEGGTDIFKKDEFANAEIYGRKAPWGSVVNAEITDTDTIRIKKWLADNYRFEPSNDRINEAVCSIADSNRFHPVREFLGKLPPWDGTPRIDFWLRDCMNATAPEPYLSAISRKTLVAMVKRVMEPGCKFDYVLILEGTQGVGKSTAVRMLAGDLWFSDAHINISDKDAVLAMKSIWVIELGELSGMRKADVDQLKEFISRTTDRIRVPYGKRTENFPRQCIFIGTTNSREYLKDPTGNRRFWPVEVGACDFSRIKRERDQLLAEALFAYELGEPLYLEEKEMVDGAVTEQEARATGDAWDDLVSDWLHKDEAAEDEIGPKISRERFTMLELFSDFGPLAGWKPNQPELKRAGESLRKLGYERYTAKVDGRAKKVWEPKRAPDWIGRKPEKR